MGDKFLKKRWHWVLVRTIGTIVLLVLIIGVTANFYFSPKLDQKLKNIILTSTDSLYSLNFSKANLHIIQGKIVLDDLVLQPNMAVYNRKKKLNLAPNSLYEVKIKRLVISHIHPFTLYFKKKLDIDQLVISEPDLQVTYEQNRDQDTVLQNKKTPYQLISKVLKSIHIQSILLDDVKLKYVNLDGSKADAMEFKELNLNATDFLLDSISQFSKTRFLFCSDVSAELNNYNGTSDDQLYTYHIAQVRFSTRSSELNVNSMSFLPNESVTDFFRKSKSDNYSIRLDSLKLEHFDFKSYSKYHKLFASKLTLNNGSLQIFSNPGSKDTIADHSDDFPQLKLKRLKMDVKVDTIAVNKVTVTYTEFNKKSNQTGSVNFNNISGTVLNITNNKAALQKNDVATAQLQTDVMNAARLTVNLSFKLNDENTPFSYNGSLGTMDLKKMNPVTMPLAMVKISSGKVKGLDFDYQANRKFSKGKLRILYNDLRVSILKRDSDNNLKKMSIASLLANALVIKRDNPAENQSPRVANVLWVRKPSSSIFTFMWKSMLTGLKDCAGYDKQTETTVKQKISDFKQSKLTRGVRKAQRKQRRAERKAKRELKNQEKLQQSEQDSVD